MGTYRIEFKPEQFFTLQRLMKALEQAEDDAVQAIVVELVEKEHLARATWNQGGNVVIELPE